MSTKKTVKENDFNVEIGLKDGQEWSADKLTQTKKLIKELAAKRSPERLLKNEFLAIQYKMEEYAEANEKHITKSIPLETFLHEYLETLNISFRKFAIAIDMNDANLKKYITGERKFNPDLARKFGRFFHISPITWMKVYQLNDLIKLRTEKIEKRYDKYDFRKVAQVSSVHHAASSVKPSSATVTVRGASAKRQK